MRSTRTLTALAATLGAAAVALGAMPVALAAFSSPAESAGNLVAAANDFRPPQIEAATLGKASGGAPGFVRQGGGYFVYAKVAADTGKPASGIASVLADARNVTAGATAVPWRRGRSAPGESPTTTAAPPCSPTQRLRRAPSPSRSRRPTTRSTRPASTASRRSTTRHPARPTCRRRTPARTGSPSRATR